MRRETEMTLAKIHYSRLGHTTGCGRSAWFNRGASTLLATSNMDKVECKDCKKSLDYNRSLCLGIRVGTGFVGL